MALLIAIAAIVIAIAVFSQQVKGILIWLCILLGLFLAIRTIGCDSIRERREQRQEQRKEKWEQRKEKRNDPIIDGDEDDNHRRRRFRFLREENEQSGN